MNDTTLLLVDDEPQIRRVLQTTVCEVSYVVIVTKNGQEEIDTVVREQPDLVLLYINLPDMSGFDACRLIRLSFPMEIYENTPAGDFRRAIALQGERILIGDPVKMAQAMIASCDRKPAPRRLVLGSDAYQHIEASLVERLALLRSQKELAFSTDLSS